MTIVYIYNDNCTPPKLRQVLHLGLFCRRWLLLCILRWGFTPRNQTWNLQKDGGFNGKINHVWWWIFALPYVMGNSWKINYIKYYKYGGFCAANHVWLLQSEGHGWVHESLPLLPNSKRYQKTNMDPDWFISYKFSIWGYIVPFVWSADWNQHKQATQHRLTRCYRRTSTFDMFITIFRNTKINLQFYHEVIKTYLWKMWAISIFNGCVRKSEV